MLNDQVAGIETLGVGICLSVLEETEKELGGLDWPSGSGDTESLAYDNLSVLVSNHFSYAGSEISYLVQHVRFLQRIFSSGRPPCVLGRSPKT